MLRYALVIIFYEFIPISMKAVHRAVSGIKWNNGRKKRRTAGKYPKWIDYSCFIAWGKRSLTLFGPPLRFLFDFWCTVSRLFAQFRLGSSTYTHEVAPLSGIPSFRKLCGWGAERGRDIGFSSPDVLKLAYKNQDYRDLHWSILFERNMPRLALLLMYEGGSPSRWTPFFWFPSSNLFKDKAKSY